MLYALLTSLSLTSLWLMHRFLKYTGYKDSNVQAVTCGWIHLQIPIHVILFLLSSNSLCIQDLNFLKLWDISCGHFVLHTNSEAPQAPQPWYVASQATYQDPYNTSILFQCQYTNPSKHPASLSLPPQAAEHSGEEVGQGTGSFPTQPMSNWLSGEVGKGQPGLLCCAQQCTDPSINLYKALCPLDTIS